MGNIRGGCVASLILVTAHGVNAQVTEFRSLDGSGNNTSNPAFGQAGQGLLRAAPANYGDGIGSILATRPNARAISNIVHAQSSPQPDARRMSEFGWIWGQFIDHDIDHTLLGDPGDQATIMIPNPDPVFNPGQLLVVTRSMHTGGVTTPREQVNNISAFIDASMVYGGRANEPNAGIDRANWLREFAGGRLRVSIENGEAFPPRRETANAPVMGGGVPDPLILFGAGDVRGNENPGLLSMHTLFVRAHNRIADDIALARPDLNDEQLYQAARKVIGAITQAITYNEFLPAMGISIPAYAGYDPDVDAGILNEFAHGAFRTPHSQINDVTLRLNADGTTHATGHIQLHEGFFNPNKTVESGIGPILRGLGSQVQEAMDPQVQDGLRNLLFGPPISGPIANASDVIALDIQRGRDHGVAYYNDLRVAFGLAPISAFGEMTSNPTSISALTSMYGSVAELDLFTGATCEDHLPGTSIGALNHAIWADQFTRLRDGDRFFYLSDPDFATGGFLDTVGYGTAEVNATTLASLLEADAGVTGIGVAGNVFFVPCYADCTADGTLDFFDFLCFQNSFSAGEPYADCDGSGTLDFFDFLCYQNEFQASCP